MYDEIMEQPAILKKCGEYNLTALKEIVARINSSEPRCIIIAARGTSDHAAIYAKY